MPALSVLRVDGRRLVTVLHDRPVVLLAKVRFVFVVPLPELEVALALE